MPYYVFKITDGITPLVKSFEKINDFSSFSKAKNLARELRATLDDTDTTSVKVMFADNALHAEEQLQEKREQPILREWEK